MPLSARLVSVDYGTKRVGVAVTDPLRMFTRPYGTYTPGTVLKALQELAATEGIDTLVIGWPLTPEGEEGEATAFVQAFIDRVRKALPEVPVVTWDERYSSVQAKEAIRAAGVRKKGRRDKARVDAAAAALILQDYLDAQS